MYKKTYNAADYSKKCQIYGIQFTFFCSIYTYNHPLDMLSVVSCLLQCSTINMQQIVASNMITIK